MTGRARVLVTGASSGLGAVYADRFARRGHNLVLVARSESRLQAVAKGLRAATGVEVEILLADLTSSKDLHGIEARLESDPQVAILVNNAGAAPANAFAAEDPSELDRLIALNVIAPTRLAAAAVRRFLSDGRGAIVNISSILALAPEAIPGIYSATKAYVLALSQSLQTEFGQKNIYVQAVLPGATRTEIWDRSGRSTEGMVLMGAEEMVDAALVGFDRRELLTIPSLLDEAIYEEFDAARKNLLPNARNRHAASRYRP